MFLDELGNLRNIEIRARNEIDDLFRDDSVNVRRNCLSSAYSTSGFFCRYGSYASTAFTVIEVVSLFGVFGTVWSRKVRAFSSRARAD